MHGKLKSYKHWSLLFLLSASLFSFSLAFIRPDIVEVFEQEIYDQYFQLRGYVEPPRDIVIVSIDDESLTEVGRWPWSRDTMALLVEQLLGSYHVKVAGFDVIFSEQQRNPLDESIALLKQDTEDHWRVIGDLEKSRALGDMDGQLELVLAKYHDKIVAGYFFYGGNPPDKAIERLKENEGLLKPSAVLTDVDSDILDFIPKMAAVEGNLPRFTQASDYSGFFNAYSDSDGTIRRTPLLASLNGNVYPSLALQTLRVALGNPALTINMDYMGVRDIQLGSHTIHTDNLGLMLMNHYGKGKAFTHVSAADVLYGRVRPQVLKDAIVLIGPTAIGIHDIRRIPFDAYFPGVEGHAASIANMLYGSEIHRPAILNVLETFGILLLAMTAGLLVRRKRPILQAAITIAFPVALFFIGFLLFSIYHIWFKVAYLILACLLTTMPMMLSEYIAESRRRNFIHHAFECYLSPHIIKSLIDKPDMLKLGGEERKMTVMFSDIANFSSFSEKMSPKELVHFMNTFLTAMSDIILKHDGTIDKYEGDAIMAFFGAPISMDDHAKRAVLAGLEQQLCLISMCEQWLKEGYPPVRIRLGINSGNMVVGNMGTTTRMNYTVMGDHVNLAARLEGICKYYKVPILISEYTYALIQDDIVCRFIDRVRVVGRANPVKLYQPLHAVGNRNVDAVDSDEGYRQAWDMGMIQGDFSGSVMLFNKLQEKYPDDPLYAVLSKQVQGLCDNPPDADWDGVFNLRNK